MGAASGTPAVMGGFDFIMGGRAQLTVIGSFPDGTARPARPAPPCPPHRDGRLPHVVLLELFSDAGVGTMITAEATP